MNEIFLVVLRVCFFASGRVLFLSPGARFGGSFSLLSGKPALAFFISSVHQSAMTRVGVNLSAPFYLVSSFALPAGLRRKRRLFYHLVRFEREIIHNLLLYCVTCADNLHLLVFTLRCCDADPLYKRHLRKPDKEPSKTSSEHFSLRATSAATLNGRHS